MRLICPHCMNAATVPDDAAGQEATCPNCGRSFPTPARYTATVAAAAAAGSAPPPGLVPAPHPPAAPPGYVPPADAGRLPPGGGETPAAAGYTKSVGITFDPKVIAWLPAVFLLLTLVLTMFTWVGCYAGNSAVYSQGPWRAAIGRVYRNFTLEKLIPIPPGWADKMGADWLLMLPYLLALVAVVLLAWADRGPNAPDPQRHPQLAQVWAHREALVLGLASFVLVLSLAQVWRGFGMERAMRQTVDEKFTDARAKAAASPSELERIDYEKEQEYAKFNIETTTWAHLALTCNALAVLTAALRWALTRGGNRPPPRLALHY